jgi:hypothetical protein
MGNLKPGVPLIHERVGNVVYSREFGADPMTRKVTGWDYNKDDPNFDPRTGDGRPLHEHIMDSKLWGEIRRAARDNPALQQALERIKILYYLSKEDGNSKT